MHDQVGVRVPHRCQHVQEELDPRLDREALLIAVALDVAAFHILEHEIELPGRSETRVDDSRDVEMSEPAQHTGFAAEALLSPIEPEQCKIEQFDGDLAFEVSIVASGEPHSAHAAPAEK